MNAFPWDEETPLNEVIGNALGAASLCWTPIPEGVFDSERASEIIDQVVEWIEGNFTLVRK